MRNKFSFGLLFSTKNWHKPLGRRGDKRITHLYNISYLEFIPHD